MFLLKCIKTTTAYPLTEGKYYLGIAKYFGNVNTAYGEEVPRFYLIKDDLGNKHAYLSEMFEVINNNISEILYEKQ